MGNLHGGGPVERPRRGSILASFSCLGLLLALTVLVMALSNQSSTTRLVQESLGQNRYAAELAESCLDECLADFTQTMVQRTAGRDMRSALMSAAQGGRVPPGAIGGAATFSYVPRRTLALINADCKWVTLSPVVVQLLYYSTLQNYGELDISATASSKIGGRRKSFRRITSRYYFVLNTDGRTFRVNPVASQSLVDRSSDV
jgi:hypothetical protein